MANGLIHRPVEQSEWAIMREQASMLLKSGFLPEAVSTPEKAVAIMLKGRELNIPPMYALSNIAVIKGKPVANAELMLALIYRDQGDNAIKFTTSDTQVCTVEYRRRSWTKPETYSFTIQDARTAGLLGNTTWTKYPQAMLRARCISAVARMAFADTIGGLYTPEELGATVVINEEGEVQTVVDVEPAEQPAPRPSRRDTMLGRINGMLTEVKDRRLSLPDDLALVEPDAISDGDLQVFGVKLREFLDMQVVEVEHAPAI